MEENKDYLLLKWGTIKGWCLKNSPEAFELLKEYNSLGVTYSVMAQKDTARQKELILQIIDAVNGPIENDWTGETYPDKEKAKQYILEYGKEKV
jgi:hypothetical protein